MDTSSEKACSAVEIVLPSGVFITMTPRAVAASTSTLSTPTPARPTTLSALAASRTRALTLVSERTTSAAQSGMISRSWSSLRPVWKITSKTPSLLRSSTPLGEMGSATNTLSLSMKDERVGSLVKRVRGAVSKEKGTRDERSRRQRQRDGGRRRVCPASILAAQQPPRVERRQRRSFPPLPRCREDPALERYPARARGRRVIPIALAFVIAVVTLPYTFKFQRDRFGPITKKAYRMSGLDVITEMQAVSRFGPPLVKHDFSMTEGSVVGSDGGPEEVRGAQSAGLRRADQGCGGGLAVSAVFDGARDDLEAAGFVSDDLVSRAARGDRPERGRARTGRRASRCRTRRTGTGSRWITSGWGTIW